MIKRGNLRTHKDHKTNLWKIQGRKNGIWVDAWDEDREKQGLPKDLIFDLEYDACGYLLGFIEWVKTDSRIYTPSLLSTRNNKKVRNKRKMVKQSKRRNRKR